MSMPDAMVAGGGIGGMTAALALAANGLSVVVLEQADALTEVGAGLQLSPNASRVLHALGLQDGLQRVAFVPTALQFRHWRSGRMIHQAPLGETMLSRYGAPYYHVHRGDLLDLLVHAARQQPLIQVHTGARVTACHQTSDRVEVDSTAGVFSAGLLVGADGIHSTIARLLHGDVTPRFTGQVAWRMLVPADKLSAGLIEPVSSAWWGPRKHFVHYYVRGGELVNCVCVVEKQGWREESWTTRGDHDELRADFAGWHPVIGQLVDHADSHSLFKWALHDRAPMSQWGQGRITLLGDACHATLPFMAQGAAMAIEDAAMLAACVADVATQGAQTDVATALQRYETLRRPRTTRVQRGSRRNARVFHLSGVPAWCRDRIAGQAAQRTSDWLFRYDALR